MKVSQRDLNCWYMYLFIYDDSKFDSEHNWMNSLVLYAFFVHIFDVFLDNGFFLIMFTYVLTESNNGAWLQ